MTCQMEMPLFDAGIDWENGPRLEQLRALLVECGCEPGQVTFEPYVDGRMAVRADMGKASIWLRPLLMFDEAGHRHVWRVIAEVYMREPVAIGWRCAFEECGENELRREVALLVEKGKE